MYSELKYTSAESIKIQSELLIPVAAPGKKEDPALTLHLLPPTDGSSFYSSILSSELAAEYLIVLSEHIRLARWWRLVVVVGVLHFRLAKHSLFIRVLARMLTRRFPMLLRSTLPSREVLSGSRE